MWPEKLEIILEHYYQIQQNDSKQTLTIEQKERFVSELRAAYDSLSKFERRDVLVPAKSQFVNKHAIKADQVGSGKMRYEINYLWPANDGFEGTPKRVTLYPNSEYDRLGKNKGRYLSPLLGDGTSMSFLSRALPYYIPEHNIADSPAYHRYKIISRYTGKGLSTEDSVLRGVIAHAFWCNPNDGGGIQIRLPDDIERLGAVFSEVFE